MADKVQKIREEIERTIDVMQYQVHRKDAYKELKGILDYIDFLQEDPVSKDLEKASKEWLMPQLNKSYSKYGEDKMIELTSFDGYNMLDAIEFGAKWKEEHLWKPADGDDLPEIDREVIALLSNGKVVYAHRPSEYWDGKNIDTGKVTRYYPQKYDSGGWNIPDVKFWLDAKIPQEFEI